jgi:alpha-galactosidase/6-phospho-beta-glucosidase family protein
MSPVKIVIVGGGSFAWGPKFIRDIAVTPELAGSTLVLHDIDPDALELVHALGQKIVQAVGAPLSIEKTAHLDEALAGAGFVILTITTGGLEAMRHDLEIPARYGVYQPVGDTVGPGGLARALRNIPVVVEIARRMEGLCPEAWLLNYTNPMTTLCRAVTRETGIKTIGLCHEFLGVRRKLQALWGVAAAEIQATVAGINHLIWILELRVRGEDAMPRLRELAEQVIATRGRVLGAGEEKRSSLADRGMIKSRLLGIYGALPAAGDRHVAEFFPFFLTEAAERGWRYGVQLTSVEERYAWRAEDEAFIRAALEDRIDLAAFLERTSGEAANQIIAAVASHGSYSGIMNLPNRGQIANLPPDAVVETFGVVDATGAHGISVGALPPAIQAIVARHVANQELIVQAALEGDRRLALQALLNDPLTRDMEAAEAMLEEMLSANRQYLPQFFSD